MTPAETTQPARFKVRYFDARLSKRGRGVQVALFTDRAEAEAFAARNRIYAGACKVETVVPAAEVA